MEQRRKIIIPTAIEGDDALSTPHFDTEATLSARPVVPLSEPVAPPAQTAYADSGSGRYAAGATVSSWKRSTLILIVLTAVGVGIASGLAIGLYHSSQKVPAPVAAQSSVSEPQQPQPPSAVQPQPEPTATPRVNPTVEPTPKLEEAIAQTPAAPAVEEPKNRTGAKNKRDDNERQNEDRQAERDNPKRNEERVPPAVVRDRRVEDDDEDIRDERRGRREQRREERRAERRRQRDEDDDGPSNVPRNVERARQEINRIRDIFEGRQP